MIDDKAEIVKQWNNDPCGGIRGMEAGTAEYYRAVDHDRYEVFAQWMPSTMEFARFSGKRLLEVGYGQGTDLFQFARNGALVSGIDMTPSHFDIATRRFNLAGIDADLRLGDAEEMPFADASFDAVYSFGVIHHSPNTQKIIDEIHRVLRPGGRAIIGVYHRWSVFYLFSVILYSYLLRLRFLRESFRRTISRIENRQNSDACPLVKVYSKSQFGRMLNQFSSCGLVIRHLQSQDFSPVFRAIIPAWLVRKLEPHAGSYLIAKCVK